MKSLTKSNPKSAIDWQDKILAWLLVKIPRLNNILDGALSEVYDLGYRDGMMGNKGRLLNKGIKFDYRPGTRQGYGISW